MGKAANPPERGPGAARRRRPPPGAVSSGPTGGQSGVDDRLSGGLVPLGGRGRHLHGHSPPDGGHGGRGDRGTGGWSPPDSARGGLHLLHRRPHGGGSSCRGPWGDVYEKVWPPVGGQDDADHVRRGGEPPPPGVAGGRALCRDPWCGPARPSPGPRDPLVGLLGGPGGAVRRHGGPGGAGRRASGPWGGSTAAVGVRRAVLLAVGGALHALQGVHRSLRERSGGGFTPPGTLWGGDSPLRGPSRGGFGLYGGPRGAGSHPPGASTGCPGPRSA